MNPMPYQSPQKRSASLYFYVCFFCAVVSLFVFTEIFGAAAILLGAYT
jgi:hypothetical protein